MSILGRLFGGRGNAPQNMVVNMAGLTANDAMMMIGGSSISDSGVSISRDTALRLPAVYACVRVLSSTVAALPLNVHQKRKDGAVLAEDNALHPLLHDKPNEMMTSFIWREVMMGQLLTNGNHYSVIARNGKNEAVALYPVDPELVTTIRKDGKKHHIIKTSAGNEAWRDEDVIHIPGFGFDGIKGLSPIQNFAREALGQAQATQSHTSSYFKEGANLGSVLETDQKIELPRQNEILSSFKANFTGVKNAKKTALLVDGFKYKPVTISNEDAQLIETLKFQIGDIARIFGVPPHLIGDLDKATFSNIEQQGINFVQYSLLSWVKRIEQELNSKLFDGTDYFARFNLDGLQRGDFAARMSGYSTALNAGIFTINEVRALENFNRIEGGDTLRVPLNMAALGNDGFTAIDNSKNKT